MMQFARANSAAFRILSFCSSNGVSFRNIAQSSTSKTIVRFSCDQVPHASVILSKPKMMIFSIHIRSYAKPATRDISDVDVYNDEEFHEACRNLQLEEQYDSYMNETVRKGKNPWKNEAGRLLKQLVNKRNRARPPSVIAVEKMLAVDPDSPEGIKARAKKRAKAKERVLAETKFFNFYVSALYKPFEEGRIVQKLMSVGVYTEEVSGLTGGLCLASVACPSSQNIAELLAVRLILQNMYKRKKALLESTAAFPRRTIRINTKSIFLEKMLKRVQNVRWWEKTKDRFPEKIELEVLRSLIMKLKEKAKIRVEVFRVRNENPQIDQALKLAESPTNTGEPTKMELPTATARQLRSIIYGDDFDEVSLGKLPPMELDGIPIADFDASVESEVKKRKPRKKKPKPPPEEEEDWWRVDKKKKKRVGDFARAMIEANMPRKIWPDIERNIAWYENFRKRERRALDRLYVKLDEEVIKFEAKRNRNPRPHYCVSAGKQHKITLKKEMNFMRGDINARWNDEELL